MNSLTRRRVLKTITGGGINSITRNILVQEKDCLSGETFEENMEFTSAYGSTVVVYMDFTFTRTYTSINNIIAMGRNPNTWTDDSIRLFADTNDQLLIVPFIGSAQTNFDAPPFTGKRNKLICKIVYPTRTEKTQTTNITGQARKIFYASYTNPTVTVWLNGQAVCTNFSISGNGRQECLETGWFAQFWQIESGYTEGNWDAIMGVNTISNKEGTNKFYGTYHEISIIQQDLSDEELLALTI